MVACSCCLSLFLPQPTYVCFWNNNCPTQALALIHPIVALTCTPSDL